MAKQLEQKIRVPMSEKALGWTLKSGAIQIGIVWTFLILSGCTTLSSGNLIESGVVKLETKGSESVRFTDVRVSRDDDGFKVVGHISGHGYSMTPDIFDSVKVEILDSSGQVIDKKIVSFNRRVSSARQRQQGPDLGEFSSHIHIDHPEGVTVRLSYIKSQTH